MSGIKPELVGDINLIVYGFLNTEKDNFYASRRYTNQKGNMLEVRKELELFDPFFVNYLHSISVSAESQARVLTILASRGKWSKERFSKEVNTLFFE